MSEVPGGYSSIEGVESTSFDGEVKTERSYNGTVEADIDQTVPQVWFDDVPIADIIGDSSYDISSVSGLRNDEEITVTPENRSQIEETGWFNGLGLEIEAGPTVYIDHPTRHTKGLGESGDNHDHVEYFLEGRIEFDAEANREKVEQAVDIGSDILEEIYDREKERTMELWNQWADETGYREKGKLGRLWLRIKSSGPQGLGPKHMNPYSTIGDLEGSGLSSEELLETADRI